MASCGKNEEEEEGGDEGGGEVVPAVCGRILCLQWNKYPSFSYWIPNSTSNSTKDAATSWAFRLLTAHTLNNPLTVRIEASSVPDPNTMAPMESVSLLRRDLVGDCSEEGFFLNMLSTFIPMLLCSRGMPPDELRGEEGGEEEIIKGWILAGREVCLLLTVGMIGVLSGITALGSGVPSSPTSSSVGNLGVDTGGITMGPSAEIDILLCRVISEGEGAITAQLRDDS